MKLSLLAYQVVKNIKYLQDFNFTYEAFRKGEYNNDSDYSNSINNLFAPINEAIHRLSDMQKIKTVIDFVGVLENKNFLSLKPITKNIKSIVSVFYMYNNQYCKVDFRELGADKLLILNTNLIPSNATFYVQYFEDIKHFSPLDIAYVEQVNTDDYSITILEDNDVELKDYGITDTMCSYIIEYCQGKLQETIAPELANLHLTRSEQYFNDLESQQTFFEQSSIRNMYRI